MSRHSMKNPLVSVIIPTYNRSALIGESLKSALGQSYKNIEIIVVDDGSTDNTRDVVAAFAPAVEYIYKPNSGPAATRNVGIAKARGEFVAFLDSDDLWEPAKIEKQLQCFEENPQAAMVSSNFRYIDGKGRIIKDPGSEPGYQPSDFIIKDMLRVRFPFATPAFLIKKEIFAKIGTFNERLRISEDLDLLIRIGTNYQVGYVDEVLVSVRMHDSHSMRETPRYQIWLNSVTVYRSHEKLISRVVDRPQQFFANFYALAGNSALLSGKRLKAFELY
ncbi:MAG: glycosyltransferase, partial [Candidatus Omnitrophica bacterium]|nr:glycosyltransferase [Candidatus Omnitrophota bacterium]